MDRNSALKFFRINWFYFSRNNKMRKKTDACPLSSNELGSV